MFNKKVFYLEMSKMIGNFYIFLQYLFKCFWIKPLEIPILEIYTYFATFLNILIHKNSKSNKYFMCY